MRTEQGHLLLLSKCLVFLQKYFISFLINIIFLPFTYYIVTVIIPISTTCSILLNSTLEDKHSLALCRGVMVQTLVAALAHRPELASLHHLLSLQPDGSLLLFHLLHLKVHCVVCQRRTEKLKSGRSTLPLGHCGSSAGRWRTFLCGEPSLQPVQDADFGLPAQVAGHLCDLGRGSHVVQLHFAVREVTQRARHAVQGDDELGTGRVTSVLADAKKQTQSKGNR